MREGPLMVLLTLLTAVLRAADVLGRSMWPDEGATYLRLAESLPDILRNIVHIDGNVVIDTHPPFYFVLLKLWTLAGGDTEFSLKWFAVCAGVLLTPLVYVLARRAFSQRAAVVAAVFISLSPGIEWYSHEARMYTLVLCMAALAMYTLLRALRLRARDVKWWVAWAVCIALAFFTHYTFVGMLIGQVGLAGWVLARNWRNLALGLRRVIRVGLAAAGVVAVVLVLLPDVRELVARLATGNDMNYVFHSFDTLVWTQISGFIIGLNVPNPNAVFITVGVWLLAGLCMLMALLPPQTTERPDARVARPLLLVSILVTLLVWFGLSFFKSNYQGFRHLILVTPALAALLGRAVDWLLRRPIIVAKVAGVVLAIGVVAAQAYGLVYTFTRTPAWHDDWRGVSTYIQDHWQDGDVIVVDSATHLATLQPYLRGFPFVTGRWSVPDDVVTDDAKMLPYTLAVRAQYRRIWLAVPHGARLDYYRRVMHVNGPFGFPARSVPVLLYLVDTEVPVVSELPPTAQTLPGALDLRPAVGVALAGYEIHPPARYNPQSNAIVSLYWRRNSSALSDDALASINTSFRLQEQGQVWWDWLLPGNLSPMPAQWVPGTFWRVDHVLPLPLGLPKLPYTLQWAATEGAKQERFQVAEMPLPDEWRDCCVRLTQWPLQNIALTSSGVPVGAPLQSPLVVSNTQVAASPEPQSPVTLKLPNALRLWTALRGDDVQINYAEFPSTVKPGEPLQAVVTWQTAQPGTPGWDTELKLETLTGSEIASVRQSAATDAFPVKDWPAGEPVRGMYSMPVPYSVSPGWYRLMLNRWRDGVSFGGVPFGLVQVELHPPSPVPTNIANPVDARAGEVRLLGYSVEQPITRGVTLNFHTYWQVDAQPTRDGVLFLHTDRDSCRPTCPQDDNPPERGLRSTLSYRTGDGMDQVHQIVLPADAPGGEYKLYAGIYDKAGFARWPATENGQPAKDDLIYIGSFTLPDLPPPPDYKYRIFIASVLQAD